MTPRTLRLRTPLLLAAVYLSGVASVVTVVVVRRHLAHASARAAAIDWGRVSSRELDLASLFLTARDVGLRAALDSLSVLAAHDTGIAKIGHAVAHGLGRYAAARRAGDPAVFAQCTAAFSSGCYHGVMEGVAAAHPGISERALAATCDSAARASGEAPYLHRECAHGLGHAFMALHGGRVDSALAACVALSAAPDRGECSDGVYMEQIVRATHAPVVDAGDAGMAHHAQMATPIDAPSCTNAAPTVRASCWAYQSVAWTTAGVGAAQVLRDCGRAPDAASRDACRRGFGKQTAGRFVSHPDSIAPVCALGGSDAAEPCIAGAAEALVDRDWTAGPALAFCAALGDDRRAACAHAVGARLPLLTRSTAEAIALCRLDDAGAVAACRRGVTDGS